MSSLALNVFYSHFEIQFESSLAREGFGQHMLRFILCLVGMGKVCSTHVEICLVPLLACAGFSEHMLRCIFGLAGMCWVWSTHVEMHFVYSVLCVGFVQHVLRYITCPHWHAEVHFVYTLAKMCLFNTCLDIFWVLVGMLGVWVTYVEMNFCRRWHGMGLVDTC